MKTDKSRVWLCNSCSGCILLHWSPSLTSSSTRQQECITATFCLPSEPSSGFILPASRENLSKNLFSFFHSDEWHTAFQHKCLISYPACLTCNMRFKVDRTFTMFLPKVSNRTFCRVIRNVYFDWILNLCVKAIISNALSQPWIYSSDISWLSIFLKCQRSFRWGN